MNHQHPSSPAAVPKTPGSDILSLAALAKHTKQHPASPRTTVQTYLHDQRTRTFAPVLFSQSPAQPHHAPSPHQRRRPSPPEDAAELALVLGRGPEEEGKENGYAGGKRGREKGGEERTKKVSLVAAMRGRLSSQAAVSPVGSLESMKEEKEGEKGGAAGGGAAREEEGDTSSPILVARADMEAEEDEEGQELSEEEEKEVKSKKRERRIVAEEKAPRTKEGRSSAAPAKAGGSRRKKIDKSDAFESEEDREAMERLDARRERRRSKALIIKDRTQSARATGAAAAAKLKASTSRKKSKKTAEADDGDETASAVEEDDRKKKKRRASNEEVNRHVQDVHKAKNVGGSRLTLRPAVKLGIFNKGAASVRTKVGKQLPDLAFSELNFLNAPRPSPPSSSSSSSSASSAPIVAKSKTTTKPPRASSSSAKVLVTYGSKGKKPSSKYFKPATPALDSSSVDSPPPAPKSKPKSKVVAPSQPPKKKSKAKAARKSPPPTRARSVAEDDDSAQHSAYSLRQRKGKGKAVVVEQEDSLNEGPAPSEAVMDTSHAWKNGFSKAASSKALVAASPYASLRQSPLRQSPFRQSPFQQSPLHHSPLRLSHLAPSNLQPLSSLADSSSIDRLLKACETDDLGVMAYESRQLTSDQTPSFRLSSADPPRREMAMEGLWDSPALGADFEQDGRDLGTPFEVDGRIARDEGAYEEGDFSQSEDRRERAGGEQFLDRGGNAYAGMDIGGDEGSWRDVRLGGTEDEDADEEMRHELFGEEEGDGSQLGGPFPLPQYSSSVVQVDFGVSFDGVGAGGEGGGGMDAEFATAMRSHWYRAKP